MELALVSQRQERRFVFHSLRVVTRPARDDSPPRKVAALAPFVSGWALVPLVSDPILFVNKTNVSEVCILQPGDCLEIPNFGAYFVEHAEVDPSKELLGLANRTCAVEARLDGELVHEVEVNRQVLIGSGGHCDLSLAAENIEAEHTFLVYHQGFWHLLDLSGRRVARLGSKPERQLLMLSGDSAWLTEALEITVHYENKDLLDQSDVGLTPLREGPAEAEDPSANQSMTDTHPIQERPSGAESSGRTVVIDAERLADPICQRATKLCRWLQKKLADSQSGSGEMNSPGPGWRPRRGHDPLVELDRYQEVLDRGPGNFSVLHELSGYLKDLGFSDLSRIVLKEIVRYFPGEAVPFSELAQLYLEQSGDAAQPRDERIADLRRGHKYIEKALHLRPEDAHLTDLRRKITASIYVLENEPL